VSSERIVLDVEQYTCVGDRTTLSKVSGPVFDVMARTEIGLGDDSYENEDGGENEDDNTGSGNGDH
jgi:hypothetical protein